MTVLVDGGAEGAGGAGGNSKSRLGAKFEEGFVGGSCWYSGSTGATCGGIVGAGVPGTGELARAIKAEAAAVSDVFGACCWASKSPTIFCSMAVEASGGGRTSGFEGIEAVAGVGVDSGSGVDGCGGVCDLLTDGSSLGCPGKVSPGNILMSIIARKIKTQSPNHLIKGNGGST